MLVSPHSTGGHAPLVLSRFCLSLGMKSDSVFRDLFPGMQFMQVLQNGLPIPSLNALPVHRANQVPKLLCFLTKFSIALLELPWGSPGGFRRPLRLLCPV